MNCDAAKPAAHVPRVRAQSSAQDAFEAIRTHGCVIIENAVSEALVDAPLLSRPPLEILRSREN